MDDRFDLEAALEKIRRDPRNDVLRARREAEQAPPPPPSTIPEPEFLPGWGCVARYHCPLGCGWHHDEVGDPGPVGPLLLPSDFTSADYLAALTSQTEVYNNNFRLRVEQAIADHFDAAHPGR